MSLSASLLHLLPAVPMMIGVPIGIYSTSDRVRMFFYKLRGLAVIEIEGIDSAVRGDKWRSYVTTRHGGEVIAYRYPATKIGIVTLYDDGTGDYCGKVRWKLV